MAGKNKVNVRIAGNEYTVCGYESPEYMQRVALYVDQKVTEIMKANQALSTSMASILSAINVVDDMFKLAEAKDALEKELESVKRELQQVKQERDMLSQQLQKANEENKHLLLELTRCETELSEVRNSLAKATGETPPKPRLHNVK
ncbi:cell division protein ZapA [Thermoclostridium stercorarium subsp. thermolacticum DSM 2910]|jgi:cell division protein ZapA|uniref:Cell division protein ZapA n=2 Tax=Thermoclostridium stercorarium TaxID=1510 RepID=A0A1B1YNY6_THEST|nr:cell division protein ZapA [Thermoclostridium stercorarium]ANW99861.1 cell division protein ZapA [Thermoclostridium stercorarium subsp. thermolacticum DSM 2910]ANX02485.1 cell division protein ZapA [Thermoclostridium stercorarium subsp. leptospartum DSM 9219]UZQ85574.1 cell division protein ZapA [Thermoclostridium stercorarium]